MADGIRRRLARHDGRLHRVDARRGGRRRGGVRRIGGADHPARNLGRRRLHREGRGEGHDAEPNDAWSTPTNVEEADKAQAEAIADALGELVGRRLDRPTAHSIGKLFQKRLVGRPAWIGDGQTVATLRKFTGHSENTYRVDVSAPGQDADAPTANSFLRCRSRPKTFPTFPTFPDATTGDGELGKEGKEGNVVTAVSGNDVISSDAKGATSGWRARL